MALAHRLSQRLRALAHVGRSVECPLCGWRFRSFADERRLVADKCWRCHTYSRHRGMLLFIERRDLLDGVSSLLHFAPEWPLERRLRGRPDLRYVSADIAASADLRLDLMSLDLEDESFDATICSHVLEHVPDDAVALAELRRVLRPGGWALVMVPTDHNRATTHEDPSVVTPEDREREFWQHDHLRLYGRDAGERLAASGLAVEGTTFGEEFSPEEIERYALMPASEIFVLRKVSVADAGEASVTPA